MYARCRACFALVYSTDSMCLACGCLDLHAKVSTPPRFIPWGELKGRDLTERYIDIRNPPPHSPPWIMLLRDRIHHAPIRVAPLYALPAPIHRAWKDVMRHDDMRPVGAVALPKVLESLWSIELDDYPYGLTSFINHRVASLFYLHRFTVTWMAPIDLVQSSQKHLPVLGAMQREGHARRWHMLLTRVSEIVADVHRRIIMCRCDRKYMALLGRSLIHAMPVVIQTATHMLNLARSYWDGASYSPPYSPSIKKETTLESLEDTIDAAGLAISQIGEHIQPVRLALQGQLIAAAHV